LDTSLEAVSDIDTLLDRIYRIKKGGFAAKNLVNLVYPV